ncbi:MAG: chemotaxis protein CheW [Betaproteobacteria bacterium]|nr:chemotaxis protein CheW [Betaproteobacteria bacterium]
MNMKSLSRSRSGAPDVLIKMVELLTFTLGTEEYAIDILKVQEIRSYEAVTRIANTPAFIKGVINLRGVIVPIVDMRLKFQLGEPVFNELTAVIILNIGKRVIGIVVDGVSDVISLAEADIHPAPEFGTLDTQFLTGLATVDDRLLILLDIERLMSSAEMELVEQAAA